MRLRSIVLASVFMMAPALAQAANGCAALPSHAAVKHALAEARKADNGGLNLDMWATVVDRSGVVCAVAYSGSHAGAQWPLSRMISAQKANTANGLSLDASALSTANLYSGVQPGGFLYGLQESNPVDTQLAYRGAAAEFGSSRDPMVGRRIGGVNVFGGGLALYNAKGEVVGALGTSGDTSCADHNISWRMRHALKLDYVPGGVSPQKNDQIIYDITDGKSASGFGHPTCIGTEKTISAALPATPAPQAKR